MSTSTSKSQGAVPVVVLREERSDVRRSMARFVPAALISIAFHGILLLLFSVLVPFTLARTQDETEPPDASIVANLPLEERMVPFDTVEVNLDGRSAGGDFRVPAERLDVIEVPGDKAPNERVGLRDGDKDAPPVTPSLPKGLSDFGTGAALLSNLKIGNNATPGDPGGLGLNMPQEKSPFGRSQATREFAIRPGEGTNASEAAVARGLRWLIRQQMPDGRWMLNGPTLADKDRGTETNDIAATALGLLPMLAAGKTHKPAKDNPYDKNIDKALRFLIRSQDPKTGYFGVSMYAHGLATIALCEAYGLSQEPSLRRPTQAALNLIVNTQHEGGGWRYGPVKQPGDLSISGWQIMALKSGQMAGLDVPSVAIRKAVVFLDSCCSADEGYGYNGPANNNRMTAVGLLCRQYLQHWGPAHPRMIKAIHRHIKTNPPNVQDVYYYYYATQVMHHFGGEAWRDWNEIMRDRLVKRQDTNQESPNFGSWAPQGDPFGRVGGRLMMTSMNLLTLEVYYRYLPLFYREAGARMDDVVKKGL